MTGSSRWSLLLVGGLLIGGAVAGKAPPSGLPGDDASRLHANYDPSASNQYLGTAELHLNGTPSAEEAAAFAVEAAASQGNGSPSETSPARASGQAEVNLAAVRRASWGERRARPTEPEALILAQRTDASADDLIRAALDLRGTPYRWGGTSRGGFDCSGFTQYVYAQQGGVTLPRVSRDQARVGEAVGRSQLQPGDLLFFRTTRRDISHVGIYIGENQFVHAATGSRRVQVDELTGYYAQRYVTARRIPSEAETAEPAARDAEAGEAAEAVAAAEAAAAGQDAQGAGADPAADSSSGGTSER